MRTLKLPLFAGLLVVLLSTNPAVRGDALVNPDEMENRDRWVQWELLSFDKPVVSFLYNGIPSGELLPGWRQSTLSTQALSGGRTQYQMTWTDPATGLEVRVVAVDYGDYPAVEWTGYLRNAGAKVTPLIENLRGVDLSFEGASEDLVLRTTQGDNYSASSFEPLSFKLGPQARSFQPVGGRPTNGAWPYFNLDAGNEGMILALGWPGQWQAQFSQQGGVITIRGGQETTHLVLRPGEEIRTPLTAVLFWEGENWIAGQNLWRHWFLEHNIPRPDGKPPGPMVPLVRPVLVSNGVIEPAAARNEKEFVDYYLRLGGVKLDDLWIDAGWYETKASGSQGIDWANAPGIGTWKPDPVRFPHGIREVSDYVHSKGMGLILWFEPERVYRGSFLWDTHPEWLLHWNADDEGVSDRTNMRLLNLGNPAARQWLTDYISRFITEQGVDLYRQDFNVDPRKPWENNDTPDRQGMTENLYVQGYLAYWDALLQQHPGMLIDSCASGGRRNDLETLRRAVPLLRSDYQAPNLPFSPGSMTADVFDGNQGQTYGLSLWVPYYGTGVLCEDVYSARSHLCPAMAVGTDLEIPDWAAFRRQVSDYRSVADYYYGDYFPLTPYSKAEDVWMAWEFVRPVQGDGMIQAFRRENSPTADIHLKLRGLSDGAQYEFTDLDTGGKVKASGKELMSEGLALKAPAPRTALILTFKELK